MLFPLCPQPGYQIKLLLWKFSIACLGSKTRFPGRGHLNAVSSYIELNPASCCSVVTTGHCLDPSNLCSDTKESGGEGEPAESEPAEAVTEGAQNSLEDEGTLGSDSEHVHANGIPGTPISASFTPSLLDDRLSISSTDTQVKVRWETCGEKPGSASFVFQVYVKSASCASWFNFLSVMLKWIAILGCQKDIEKMEDAAKRTQIILSLIHRNPEQHLDSPREQSFPTSSRKTPSLSFAPSVSCQWSHCQTDHLTRSKAHVLCVNGIFFPIWILLLAIFIVIVTIFKFIILSQFLPLGFSKS